MALALYRRYRPDTFDGVIGQDHVTRPLSRALDEGKLTHAYLFSGPRGCGKTSSARILARCINCVNGPTSHPCGECESCKDLSTSGPGSIDVVEIDAASHGSVDDARELRERATFAPARDRYKIFILDEAHMVTGSAFNALLKIVEEPPEHVMFIFATTEPDKVIGTIRSRTHHYPFRLVPPEVMGPYLESVCEKEGIQPEAGVLKLAMRAGGGSMRDTLSVLDQLMVGSIDGTITYSDSVALLGFTPDGLIRDAMNAIIERNGSDLYGVIEKVVTGGFDPRKFVEDLLAYVRDLLVLAIAGREAESALNIGQPEQVTQDMQHQVERLNLHQLDLMAQRINTALASMSGTMSPRMRLELLSAQLLVAEQPMHTVAASAAPSAPASSSARLTQSEQNQQALSPRARARATQQAQSAPQSQSVHESPAEQIVSSSVQQNQATEIPEVQVKPTPVSAPVPKPAPSVSLNPDEAQKQWDILIQCLPQKIRSVVSSEHIPQVQLQERAGRHLMMLTFANPLSQHAFGLAVSSEPVLGETTLQKILNAKLAEHYGAPVAVAPAPRTADGQTVTPLRNLTPAQRAQVKAQVAQMAAQAALANMRTMSNGTHAGDSSDKPARGNQDADADNSDHAAEQNASPVGTSTGNSIDPWANEVSNHSYGQEDTGLAQEQNAAAYAQATQTEDSAKKTADKADKADDASLDYFMHGDSSVPAETQDVPQEHASVGNTNAVHYARRNNVGNNEEAAVVRAAEQTEEPAIEQTSAAHPEPQVSAEDDQYSMDDEQLESQATLSVQDIEKIFNAKKTVEFAADDERNPAKAQ